MATERFSKARVVAALRVRAEHYQHKWRLDSNNGTAQLKPTSQAMKDAVVDRAVAYGKYVECTNLADWIEEGSWPEKD